MKAPSIKLERSHDRIAEVTVTNDSPGLAMTARGDGRLHAFGVVNRPRFLMESPYSPDDAWSFNVDSGGGIARDLPFAANPADAAIEAFLGRPLDDSESRLLHALPSGRYALVRSPRQLTPEAHVLLGNELVPAPPNALVLGETRDSYAAAFSAIPDMRPNVATLLIGVTVLAYNGHDTMEGMWLFDFSGAPGPATPPGEIVVILPLEGPLVIDALGLFRNDGSREVKQRWAGERSAAFARWVAGY